MKTTVEMQLEIFNNAKTVTKSISDMLLFCICGLLHTGVDFQTEISLKQD